MSVNRTFKAELSRSSLQKLHDDLVAYRRQLETRITELVRRLSETGAEIAHVKVLELDAAYTGNLASSIQGYYSSGVALIYTDCWYAAFVEFGTGIKGQNSPHPIAAEHGWSYDVNDHGEEGWWYMNDTDGKMHWTKGMESRPFMHETARELRGRCMTIAREVFGK